MTSLADWSVSTFEAVHEPLVARDVLLGRTTHVRRLRAQQDPPDDRRLVLPRPLRPRRHQGDGRHVGAAAPAHRPADRHLAVRGPGPAHRQPRLRAADPARAAQRDDRRPRHLPRRGVAGGRPGPCCTACSCGSACPTRSATARPPDFTHLRRPARRYTDGRAPSSRCSSGRWPGRPRRRPTFTPLVGAELDPRAGRRGDAAARPRLRVRRARAQGAVRVDGGRPVERNADELPRRRSRGSSRCPRRPEARGDR